MRSLRTVAMGLMLAVAAAACSSDSGGTAGTSPSTQSATPSASGMGDMDQASIETGAATLRAGLSTLLQEHVYLAGIATGTALAAGPDSAEFKAAAQTLDGNSVNLSEAVGSVYGEAGGKTFLELWRAHIGFFVDYTVGAATGDKAGQAKALKDLDDYRQDFGAFIESATEGTLSKEAVADELAPHVASLAAAIDAQVAGDPKAYDLLREAASHMPHTANVLAGAIVEQFPDMFDGSVDDPASELRTGLETLLQEHVYLAGIATGTALSEGPDSKAFGAAAATLDANSIALSEAVGSVYGEAGGKTFLELWRAHIGFFVDFTVGAATGDKAVQSKAVKDLDGYRQDFGAFLESATEGILTKEAVADELAPHVESLAAAVAAQAAGDTKAYDLLREAANHMPMTGDVLAGAIVEQFPDMFATMA